MDGARRGAGQGKEKRDIHTEPAWQGTSKGSVNIYFYNNLSKYKWGLTDRARGPFMKYPPTPMAAEMLQCKSARASAGYPPVVQSAGALV